MACKRGGNSEKRKFEDDDDSECEVKRLTANSQERVRMQKINGALEDLKKCLPEQFHLHHRRMSKIRTLRSAMVYIRSLTQVLNEDNMRRQGQYMQAVDYMRYMCDSQLVHTPEVGLTHAVMQTPESMMSCYPYLGPLCAEPGSMYGTPDQAPISHSYNPRALDFSMNSGEKRSTLTQEGSSSYDDSQRIVAGMTDDYNKPCHLRLKHTRRYDASSATPLRSGIIKSESFTSPLVGDRNDNEMNLSILSANSDHGRHDNSDTRDILQGIVEGSYQF